MRSSKERRAGLAAGDASAAEELAEVAAQEAAHAAEMESVGACDGRASRWFGTKK